MNPTVTSLLQKAVGTREQPASPWTGVLYVFLALLAVALAALPVILARRKAAKMAHKVDMLEEEKKQAELRTTDESFEAQAQHYAQEAERIKKEIAAIDEDITSSNTKKDGFAASLATITSWDDI